MVFEWSLPTRLIFGAGRFKSTSKLIRGYGKRAFIVTSKSFVNGARSFVLGELLASLREAGVETSVFSDIEANPRTATIDRAGGLARDFKPRFVLAIGGGSVMDAAKCIALLALPESSAHIFDYAHRGTGKTRLPVTNALPVICIPTVAATGSEANFYAVVTDWESRRKVTVFGEPLRPAMSIVDPELTYSLSVRQTVDGAFDVISHVVESYLSTPELSPVQDNITEAIVRTVVEWLPKALAEPRNELARSQLSWSSTLALSGVLSGRDGGWPLHALEHGLSAWTDAPHGRGLAMLLPRVMAFDAQVIPEKIVGFNQRVFGVPASVVDPWNALSQGLVRYMKNVDAWTDLDDVSAGMALDDLCEKIIDHALETSAVLKRGEEPYLPNCRRIDRAAGLEILKNCVRQK